MKHQYGKIIENLLNTFPDIIKGDYKKSTVY